MQCKLLNISRYLSLRSGVEECRTLRRPQQPDQTNVSLRSMGVQDYGRVLPPGGPGTRTRHRR